MASLMDIEGLLAARPKESASHGRLPLGTALGDWRVEAYLGAGRSAEVYRVTHARMGGQGALKLLVNESLGLGDRFQLEMDVLRTLSIPSLPRFFAAGEWEGRPYYVMEYLQPLILPLERPAIVPFMVSLAKSVAALHAAGYLHRDLKPANILRRTDGAPVLIDLGLVKRFDCGVGCPRGADSTEKGSVAFAPREHAPAGAATGVSLVDGHPVGVGTRGFAAPEQLLEGRATVRSDVYALGKVMRECGGKALGSRARAVIRKATAEDPEERYASAADFAQAVGRCRRWPGWLTCSVAGMAVALLTCAICFGLGRAATLSPPPGTDNHGAHGVSALPSLKSPRLESPGPDSPGSDPSPTLDREPGESDAAYLARLLPLAAEGNGEAQCAVAEAYYHGRGTETNYVEAVRWYEAAAAAGQLGAQASLGLCRLQGQGGAPNPRLAAYWFSRAANRGHLGAMVDLAFCYHTGRGVPRDDRTAFDWAMKAAVRGHARGQCLVGEFYLDGYGVAADPRRADVWLQRAARQGYRRAQELLRDR